MTRNLLLVGLVWFVAPFHYKPFGETLEAKRNDVGYTGHMEDKELGLTYLKNRLPIGFCFVTMSPLLKENSVMQLGELEKQVLQYLWSASEADAKHVHSVLGQSRGNSLNTIQSTLDRLFKKGLLSRTKQGHAYCYRAKVDRKALIATLITNVTSDFVEDGEHSLIAAFSSASANLDDAQLDKLEQLIEQQRKLRQGN